MRKRVNIIIIVVIILVTALAVGVFSNILISQKQPQFATTISILLSMLASVAATITVYFSSSGEQSDNKNGRSEQAVIKHQQVQPSPAINDAVQDLLDLERSRFRSEKARIDSEREEQIAEWQDEALELVLVSPEAAVLVAWKGVEKALQYTIRQIRIHEQSTGDGESLQESVSFLVEQDILDRIDAAKLYHLNQSRNQVVSAGEKEKITPQLALEYIKQASHISSELLHTFRERQENLA